MVLPTSACASQSSSHASGTAVLALMVLCVSFRDVELAGWRVLLVKMKLICGYRGVKVILEGAVWTQVLMVILMQVIRKNNHQGLEG